MKRSGFAPKLPRREPTQSTYTPRPRTPAVAISDGKASLVVPLPKDAPVRSEAYRRLVAAMPCAMCGIEGYSQAAHADEGKGLGIKSDDRTCFPMCADRPESYGCHTMIGRMGGLSQLMRRAFERDAGSKTRLAIHGNGQWPTGVPLPDELTARRMKP